MNRLPSTPAPGKPLVRIPSSDAVVTAFYMIVIFVSCFTLYTWNNDFSIRYHPDEPSKVAQVLSPAQERNFNHPQLMLEATLWTMRVLNVPSEPGAALRTGRCVSAGLMSLAACAVAYAAYRAGGRGAMGVVAVSVGLCPQALAAAHYFKEDAALLAGVTCVVAASWLYATLPRRSGWRAFVPVALLGASVAVAASAKYVGALALVPALLVVLFSTPRRSVVSSIVAFFVSLIATVGVINHRAVTNFAEFRRGFLRELEHGITDKLAITMNKPNGFFISAAVEETMPHVLVLGGLGLVALVVRARRRRLRAWDVIIPVFFPALVLTALSWSIIPLNRYVLPVVVLLHVLAALGVIWWTDRIGDEPARSHRRGRILWLMTGVIGVIQLPYCLIYNAQFGRDTRDDLRAWVIDHVPVSDVIAADRRAGLVGVNGPPAVPADQRIGNVVHTSRFASELGDLDTLRDRGVRYVAVSSVVYARLFSPHVRGAVDDPDSAARLRAWYETLFRDGELVYQQRPLVPMNSVQASPEVRLYRIAPASE